MCLLCNLGAPYSLKEMEQIRNWREVKNYVIGLAGPTFRISHKEKQILARDYVKLSEDLVSMSVFRRKQGPERVLSRSDPGVPFLLAGLSPWSFKHCWIWFDSGLDFGQLFFDLERARLLGGSRDSPFHVLTLCSFTSLWYRNWLMLYKVSLPWNSESSLFICRCSYMTFPNASHLHMKVSFFPFR